MTAILNSIASDSRIAWLRRELAPFPGREITTLRILVAVALVIIISLTLQVPQLFFSAFFVFFVTKENRSLTIVTGVVMVVGATIATAFSLFLYRYTFDYPELRVPVLAGLLFIGMFLSRVFFIGPLGFVIGFFSALTQSSVENAPNTEALVRGVLYLWISLIYPIVLTVIINLVLLPAHPWDALVRGLRGRLQAAADALRRMLDAGTAGGRENQGLLDMATRGSSVLSTQLGFAESANPELKRRHGSATAAIAASEHVVCAAAALEFRPAIAISEEDRACAEALLVEILRLQNAVGSDHPAVPPFNAEGINGTLAQVRQLHAAIHSFHNSLVSQPLEQAEAAANPQPAKKPLFVADAFTNPGHVRFALKVTLAAMVCYLIYTGLHWQGISTSLITCYFIALGHTGATIRKGWLRLIGCCAGGFAGFWCIMYLIPQMESIVSLLLLAAVGTVVAAWVATGSDRISYAGLQFAFAFYMCIFQGYAPETNFTTIRDRVVGIALGIVVSSIVFRTVWPEHAIDGLRLTLARVLRNLARLLALPSLTGPTPVGAGEVEKIQGEIHRGLDTSLQLSEYTIFERSGVRAAGFTPERLEHMVATTQTLSLMTTVLLGKVKMEEWEQLEESVRQREVAVRRQAAERLKQVADQVEKGTVPPPDELAAPLALWNQIVPHFTRNDRPRLVRRVVEQIREIY